MLPNSIGIENYRAFADRQEIDLRPLTLLFGKNNAGKSALLRALPLIGDSLASDRLSPLDFESPAIKGARFQDLKWQGREGRSPTIEFHFEWDDGPINSYNLGVSYEDSWSRVVPRTLSVKDESGEEAKFTCEFIEGEELEETLTFRVESEDSNSEHMVNLSWNGMVPTQKSGDFKALFEDLHNALEVMNGGVQWLASVRKAPDRHALSAGAAPRRLGPRGGGIVDILHVDDEVCSAVSDWYESNVSRRLSVIEDSGMLRTIMTPTEEAGFDVDMVDCGEGFIQVLPVITALEMLRQPRSYTPAVLSIEEPESHLHPELQRGLAERLCEVASETSNRCIVLETHSEHLLLGVRIAILKGYIDLEDIAIHWIEQTDTGSSDVRHVGFNEKAELTGPWPSEVYSDDSDMTRRIWDLQHDH